MGKIYFIQCETGPIKIGWSANPRTRLKSYETECPYAVKVIAAVDAPRFTERHLHKFFAKYRMRGEWFVGDPSIIEFAQYAEKFGLPEWASVHRPRTWETKVAKELSDVIRRCAEPAVLGEKRPAQIKRAAEVLGITTDQAWRAWYGRSGSKMYPTIMQRFRLAMEQRGRAN